MFEPREAEKDFYIQIIAVGSILLVFAAMFASGSFDEATNYGLIKASPMYADGTVKNFETDGVGRYLRFEFNDHHGVRRSARTFVDAGFDPPDIGGPIRIAYSSYFPAVFQISTLLERSEYSFYIFCASIIFGALLITAIFHAFRQLRHHKQTSKRY